MTIARSEDIYNDDTSILICSKSFSLRKLFGTVLTEEIRIREILYQSVGNAETSNDQTQ